MSGNTAVVCCGGAGCSTASHLRSMTDLPIVTINAGVTDYEVTISMADCNVSGCRGDHNLGWALASDYADEISDAIAGYSNIIVVAGMGGGTGSGTVPVVLECVREAGAKSVSVLYVPMPFESARRSRALSQVRDMPSRSDCTILFDTGSLQDLGGGPLTIGKAIFASEEIACESIIRLADMLEGPFSSLFTGTLYTVSYASSKNLQTSAGNALGSSLFDTGVEQGKIVVSADAILTKNDKHLISEVICDRTGILPDVVSGKDPEGHGMMLFIPISSRAL